jgi:hypothetical protein
MKVDFVKWSCGCVGLMVPNMAMEDVVLLDCRGGGADVRFSDMATKEWEPLEAEDVVSLLREMGELIGGGLAFRDVKALLSGGQV